MKKKNILNSMIKIWTIVSMMCLLFIIISLASIQETNQYNKESNIIENHIKQLEVIGRQLEHINRNLNVIDKQLYFVNKHFAGDLELSYHNSWSTRHHVVDHIKPVLELSQLVQAEAGNQNEMGMRLVADVVLNRVDSPDFPNTIHDVIYQDGQFSVVSNGSLAKTVIDPNSTAFIAAYKEYWLTDSETRVDENVLYFNAGDRLANGEDGFKYIDHWFGY